MEPISNLPCRTISSKNPRVQFQSSELGPEAINESSCPYRGTQAVYLPNSAANCCPVKLPPHPQDSVPTPQKRTPNGSGYPDAARVSAHVVLPAGELQYSTQWSNSSPGRLRTLAAR